MLACSSCGCTLNSDWASQGYAVGSGLRIDARFDYFDQSDLRSGTGSVDRSALELPNEEEIQRGTVNRNTTIGIDYSHSHGIGDIRVTGRYQGFSADGSTGVLFGLKLATGATDTNFYAGPQAGERLDAGLQAGTGTTDALIGVYNFGDLASTLGYFAQATLQQPLAAHDAFRPGTGLNLNAGLRYTAWQRVTPQLQFNVRSEKRESGANADIPNSGATLAYLSPGINVRFNRHWDGFAYVQLPVYQRVNGLQLEPDRLYSIGLQYHL